jgi:tRNA(fMet)-specific endonuclease VapC
MTYLVDTDYVVDWLKGRPEAVQLLTTLRRDGLAISHITYGEVYEGIEYGRDRTAIARGFRQFLRGVTLLPTTQPIMRRFAQVRGQLRAQGQLIGDMDLLIAATALATHRTLVTRNHRHFARVPGLSVYQQPAAR